jgi:uncharacterized protein YijF (DUF1287 family)
VKKPHKSKAKPRRDVRASAPKLVANSTRRAAPQQAHPRRVAAPRFEPAVLYRRPHPLTIESTDDSRLLRLLLLPFALMALMTAVVPSLHVFPTLRDLIQRTPQIAALPLPPGPLTTTPAAPALAPLAAAPVLSPSPPANMADASPGPATLTVLAVPHSPAAVPVVTAPASARQAAATQSIVAVANAPRTTALQPIDPPLAGPMAQAQRSEMLPVAAPATALKPGNPAFATLRLAPGGPVVAMLRPPPGQHLTPVPAVPLDTSCPVDYGSAQAAVAPPDASLPFGRRLAQAAAAQTRGFVIYDDKYRQIAATRGDVPALFGVCTDVIVRAYRTLGVDLQGLVQASRLGAGDPNIDHRRTETLRRYLARYGATLAPSSFAENYMPGDIVTYWRPQNSGSRSHIAVVADTLGPSGNPMIIHNRGWGPQMEDALFVDRITGHYRYDAAARPAQPPLTTTRARPLPGTSLATPITLRKSVTSQPTAPAKPAGL